MFVGMAQAGPRCGIIGAGRTRNGLGPFLARDLEALEEQLGNSREELAAQSLLRSVDLDVVEPMVRNCPVRKLAVGEALTLPGLMKAAAGSRTTGAGDPPEIES